MAPASQFSGLLGPGLDADVKIGGHRLCLASLLRFGDHLSARRARRIAPPVLCLRQPVSVATLNRHFLDGASSITVLEKIESVGVVGAPGATMRAVGVSR